MSKPSTRNLKLPRPARLERLCQSLAMLDAIVMPEWQYRYHSFNARWDPEQSSRMGSVRNGSGDDVFVLFTDAGAAIKGYAHESPMASPGTPPAGVFEGFPAEIEGFLTEPAFTMEDTTFCLWCTAGGQWSIGPVSFPDDPGDPDGSALLLERFDGVPKDYQTYASDVFELEVAVDVIRRVYDHEPLTEAMVQALNPEVRLGDLTEDLAEIGYPSVPG